jgi:hypothetical protein
MPQAQPAQQHRDTTEALHAELRRRIPPAVRPEDAVSAVMCTFSQHVSGTEARNVFADLPAALKPLLERCMLHRDEPAEEFGRDQLIVRVATHLGISLEEAEQVTGAVLTAVNMHLPAQSVSELAAQLPEELRELWVAGR